MHIMMPAANRSGAGCLRATALNHWLPCALSLLPCRATAVTCTASVLLVPRWQNCRLCSGSAAARWSQQRHLAVLRIHAVANPSTQADPFQTRAAAHQLATVDMAVVGHWKPFLQGVQKVDLTRGA